MHTTATHISPRNFVKTTGLLCCIVTALLLAETASAQTWYIKPTAEIPLRRGTGTDYKILAIVPDGTAVSITEEEDGWARVTTEGGKRGWILKRYLTQDPPLDQMVLKLREENQALEEEAIELRTRNEDLSEINSALEETLANNKEQLASTMARYQKLVEDTSDVISIKEDLGQSKQTITRLQQQLGEVAAENKRLNASNNIKWFLAGGGTLIFGWLVGLISSRSKKRKSSLY